MRDNPSTQKLLVLIGITILLLIGSTTAVVAWQSHKQGVKTAEHIQAAN